MLHGPHFRTDLLSARAKLEEGRRKLAEQHRRGVLGVQVSASLTALMDEIVIGLFHSAIEDVGGAGADELRQQIALVPHGGYGRRHLSPFSDVDLMILHEVGRGDAVAAVAQRLLQDIFDIGLSLGQSVRTPATACHLAKTDPIIFSSLVEARYLAGGESIFRRFSSRFHKLAQRQYPKLHGVLVESRREERIRYGETVYLLEPNIKRSRGALRDIHLLRWIGFAPFGAADPDRLHLLGAFSRRRPPDPD